ncbi:TPA: LysR substrate-binding domain-containing protein [Enterobacter ludwigii]
MFRPGVPLSSCSVFLPWLWSHPIILWLKCDMGAKHAFLRAGLGWGYMPLPMVEDDIANGRLVILNLEMQPDVGPGFSMHAVHMTQYPPGPAGRWFINKLKTH